MANVVLRDMLESDLPILFEQQKDPVARHMVAFTLKDPDDWDLFYELWGPTLADERIIKKTVTVDRCAVGYVLYFTQFGKPSVGYWITREHWGKGIATNALQQFLAQITDRPLYARTARDNIGSRKVLEKCGFVITGENSLFSNVRRKGVEELIFTLFA